MAAFELALTQGKVAVIDADDFERRLFVEFSDGAVWNGRICDRTWHASPKSHTTYANAVVRVLGKQREIRLHRLVLCARAGDIVDHVDRNGLNCRRTNLRFVTAGSNNHNRCGQGETSRFKGVTRHKLTGKWESAIRHDRRKRHLGLFPDEISAAQAYDRAAASLFGETALLNFPVASIGAAS